MREMSGLTKSAAIFEDNIPLKNKQQLKLISENLNLCGFSSPVNVNHNHYLNSNNFAVASPDFRFT